jgi:putative transposase
MTNMVKRFSAGSAWRCGERVVQIDGPLTLQLMQVRDLATGQIMSVSVSELAPLPEHKGGTDPLQIPQRDWDRALGLAQAFAPYAASYALPKATTTEIAQKFGLSERHVLRLRAKFLANAQTTSIVPRPKGRRVGSRLLNDEVEHVIAHVISRHYAKREPESKRAIVERVRLLAKRTGLPPPSRRTILSRIHAQEGFALDIQRLGAKRARQHWEARPGKLTAEQPLDLVQIDHTLVDVNLVSDDGSRVIGRPWLTLAIDVATRAVVGFYLTMDAPSSISVAMCVAHMLAPKPEGAEVWPMYGKPHQILVDNGKDLRSAAFQRGCEQHGIELSWRPPREPHYGAHIERLNGTLMRMVHTLPGTTFSNARHRGDYPSERRACLTLKDLGLWFVEQICRGYHVRRHRGIGMPPLLAWERAFTHEDGTLVPPEVPLGPMHIRRDFYPFVIRRLQRTGIQWARSRYWHSALAALIHADRSVMVHYNPLDRSRVWVRVDDSALIEAIAVAGPAVDEAKAFAIESETQDRLDEAMSVGYDASDAITDQAQKRRRTRRSDSKPIVPLNGRNRRGGRTARSAPPAAVSELRPTVPLNRGAVRVEEFDS